MSDQFINIVFRGFPSGGDDCVFVEVEDSSGDSISIGEWVSHKGLAALRLPDPRVAAELISENEWLREEVKWLRGVTDHGGTIDLARQVLDPDLKRLPESSIMLIYRFSNAVINAAIDHRTSVEERETALSRVAHLQDQLDAANAEITRLRGVVADAAMEFNWVSNYEAEARFLKRAKNE